MAYDLAIEGGAPVRTEAFPSWPIFGRDEERGLIQVLRSGRWGRLHGEQVAQFERAFAAYHDAKHGIAVVNGTVSLRIALLAAAIKAGDEVIVPPYTFIATATAVAEANATPVFADIELETFNLSPRSIEAAITDRTKAIIPVHMGGLPADMDAIMGIADHHELMVIEDAAHAHGGEYKGRRVGSVGHVGSFSFQSTKNLTSGEGGIIITSDDELAERCRSIHNCGRMPGGAWYEHHVISGNYRLGEFQGVVLNCQLARLEGQVQAREQNGKYLAERLAQIPGIMPQARGADCTRHGYHLFLFRIDSSALGLPRESFLEAVQAEGIPVCGGYAIPIYRQALFTNLAFGPYTGYQKARPGLDFAQVCCPNCESICSAQGAWMEQRLLLGSRGDMDDIVRAFEKVYENRGRLAERVTHKEGTVR